MRTLLVERDRNIGQRLVGELQAHDHLAVLVETGEQAVAALREHAFDIVLLNRAQPDTEGWRTLAQLHACPHPAIIILSARGHDSSTFLPRMLLKSSNVDPPRDDALLMADDLVMNVRSHAVWRAGQPVALTDKEFRLLRLLLERRGQVVARETLLAKVWGYDFDPRTNLIDVHMSKLRRKIERPCQPELLKTVRAVGYMLR